MKPGRTPKLRYVFDISDTHMVAGAKPPYLADAEHQKKKILTHLAESMVWKKGISGNFAGPH